MGIFLLMAAALAGGPRLDWPEGTTHRWFALVSREVDDHDTTIADGTGEVGRARAVTLALVLRCTATRQTAVEIDARCQVEDAGLEAVPADGDTRLADALTFTEARIEATGIQVVLGRRGRLRWVQAMERDGVLWSEFEGLSSWIVRALSPLDVRLRDRDRPWRMRSPAAGRLFADVPATGLVARVHRDGDAFVQRATGTWNGEERLQVRMSARQRYDDRVGLVIYGEADVEGWRAEDVHPSYRMRARVRYLGAASVRRLGSRVVDAIAP